MTLPLMKRLGLAVALTTALYGVQLPYALAAPSPPQSGRVLVSAPESPAIASILTAAKQDGGWSSARANHIHKLTAAQIADYQLKSAATVTDSSDGVFQAIVSSNGHRYLLTLADGVLSSGRDVIGMSAVDLDKALVPVASLAGLRAVTTASAARLSMGMCSYTQNNSDGSQYVYICTRDLTVIGAMLAFQLALIAIFGGVVGAMVAAFLALLLAIGYWYFQNPDGSIGFTIPYSTIYPPPGGSAWTQGHWGYWGGQSLWYYDQNNLACQTC